MSYAEKMESLIVERDTARNELKKERAEISRLESIIADFWTQAEKTNSAFNFYLRKERDTLRTDYSALREKHDKLSAENATLIADGRKQFRKFIEQRAEIAALRAFIESLKNPTPDQLVNFVSVGLRHAEIENLHYADLKPAFSRYIDAARAQAEKEGLVENMAVVENMDVI